MKSVLESIRDYIKDESSTDIYNLWSVLSALRGPDTDLRESYKESAPEQISASMLKYAITDVIRFHAFPNLTALEFPADYSGDTDKAVEIRNQINELQFHSMPHFVHHGRLAFTALGLMWTERNPDPPKEPR